MARCGLEGPRAWLYPARKRTWVDGLMQVLIVPVVLLYMCPLAGGAIALAIWLMFIEHLRR